ncbi:ABC transporter substrate-binding protein [Trinickia caryophylli]|uniref:Peptide/nickel transport system substrate-binding protein n=1 Tax=Trinickia caryophylli TaxID=28094 RepID=A0A1X7DH38_TRICW|nr:ABC transporter substrate-binding protein [Trinickia caryophylli]PMS12352.1 peptide ABC transporter substrate-binding protein [Trinickia caryophylli]TRX16974.1 ABC transporter substrate-binding protein [Trinickia caryophylli]WQE12289.1 ABC transporter substrate-binding protein [Trinickia caryophylli]SMF15411.1 peptide/nickel transport system substrate-binding protein [Trinickia caryophylli]GLU31565.1 ABC transporter substrate-binding protein [Trinickia caryophylli]
MRRRQMIGTSMAAAGLAVAAPAARALRGTALHALVQPEPPGLMLGLYLNTPTQLIAGNVYESLLRFDEQLTPLPSLARAWTVSADQRRYTFHLQPGVSWHDGKPFTSADAVFSVDVFLRHTHARLRANLAVVESIRALDPLTVEFRLVRPFSAFLNLFEVGTMPMVPRHLYEGTDFRTNPANAAPVGTGPYRFARWERGAYIQLTRNERYYRRDEPHIDNVYFHVIPDAAARAVAFETGRIDVVPGGAVEYFDVARLGRLPGARITTHGWEFFSPLSWLWVNHRRPPLDRVALRRALACAIDREAIARIAWQGFAKPASGPFNSHVRYFSRDVAQYPYDPARARALVSASGYRGETLRLLPLPYGEVWSRTAEMVRQNLLQAGVKVVMTPTDVAGWSARLGQWDYDLAFTYVHQFGDPAIGIAHHYTSDNIAQGSPFNNVEGYRNPKVDALFAAGARETDDGKRAAIYAEVQKVLADEVPNIWLHELTFPTLYRSRVNNVVNSGIGLNDSLGRAWLA